MYKNIYKSIFMIFAVLAITVSSSGAYFTDQVNIRGNQITTASMRVVINEVYYDTGNLTYENGTKTEEEGKNEWIELYNPNGFAINIKNWSLTDNSGVAHPINANVSIPANGFALLSHDNSTWQFWGDPSGTNLITVNLGGNPGTGWLSNSGDRLFLKNASGEMIDSMSYGTDSTVLSPACTDVAEGHSLEREPDGKDTNVATDFIDRVTPTPGA